MSILSSTNTGKTMYENSREGYVNCINHLFRHFKSVGLGVVNATIIAGSEPHCTFIRHHIHYGDDIDFQVDKMVKGINQRVADLRRWHVTKNYPINWKESIRCTQDNTYTSLYTVQQ